MKAGLVRLGVTTTPEQAASASASSRMIGPAFRLIRIAWVSSDKIRRSSHTFLGVGNGAGSDDLPGGCVTAAPPRANPASLCWDRHVAAGRPLCENAIVACPGEMLIRHGDRIGKEDSRRHRMGQ